MSQKSKFDSDDFFQRLFSNGFYLFEGHEPYFQENLLQIVWNEQLFKTPLFTESGDKLEITHKGIWNVETGPDFQHAEISISGIKKRGWIEIHFSPEDWIRHQHQIDPAYNNVILHVVWNNPKELVNFPSNVPLFSIRKHLLIALEDVVKTFNPSLYPYARKISPGKYANWFSSLSNDRIIDLTQSFGMMRVFEKARRYAQQIIKYGIEDTAYKALFDGMGYKINREGFAKLSSKISLNELSQYPEIDALAVLFGTAGLLPDPSQTIIHPEYLVWVKKMWTSWWDKRQDYSPIKWKKNSYRPLNSPERRLLAAYYVLKKTQFKLGSRISEIFKQKNSIKNYHNELKSIFTIDNELNQKKFISFTTAQAKSASLLGANRVNDLLINFAIPFSLGHFMIEENLEYCQIIKQIARNVPKLQSNRIFKEAVHHFFIPPERSKAILKNACSQQGLLKLYKDFHHNLN